MSDLIIEGGTPLMGNVGLSGAKNSAVKLLYASLFSNEDVLLENFPQLDYVEEDIAVIRSLGADVKLVGTNRILINSSNVNTFEVPYEIGSLSRMSLLSVPALLFRFGRASIPKIDTSKIKNPSPVNRIVDVWRNLGFIVEEDDKFFTVRVSENTNESISFKAITHTGTDNAILSSAFLQKETTINNASEESEIDDLINFLTFSGVSISRPDPKTIKIHGTNIFKGCSFRIQSDKTEAITFSTAAALTKGNIVIEDVNKTYITAFTSFLSNLGIKFEFDRNNMRVWNNLNTFASQNITISPAPGFLTDWSSCAALLLNYSEGESTIHETVYTNRFDYIKDLNRMGADIELLKPSELGISHKISDDSYDFEELGEPATLIKIIGPNKLKGTKLDISSYKWGAVQVLSALCAEGKSEISGWKNLERGFENFFEKLHKLGAKITSGV